MKSALGYREAFQDLAESIRKENPKEVEVSLARFEELLQESSRTKKDKEIIERAKDILKSWHLRKGFC